ncbi:alpha-2-macroglobulin-like, partial [Heterodontus francisci]|uniref:alpha-2-macroglobulin-like n=1 Tax=Heterodontus francisci TaxID=7792 RepID=UPI00355C013F
HPLVTMLDPQGNRIGQWRDVEPRQGIADLTFDLMPEPLKGFYTIEVKKTRGKVHHHFSVQEYVLPKYELKVEMPKMITILDRTIHVKVCGRYTYGQPVRGEVNGSVCLMMSRYSPQLSRCEQVTGETDSDGCLIKDISTAIFRLRSSRYNYGLHAHFVLEEEGTGLVISKLATTEVITEITQITFHKVEDYFKTGLPYTGKVKISHSTGRPVPNATIYIFNSQKPGLQQLISDQDGMATFSLDTSSWGQDPLSILAIYQINYDEYSYRSTLPRHSKARHQVKPFYSKSNSYLTIVKHPEEIPCDSDLDVQVHYTIKGLHDGEQHDLDVFYLVMSRGLIVSLEMKTISVGGSE